MQNPSESMLHTLGCAVCAHMRLEVDSSMLAAIARCVLVLRQRAFRGIPRYINHLGIEDSVLESLSCGVHFSSDAVRDSDFSLRDSCLKIVSSSRWIASFPRSSNDGCNLKGFPGSTPL